MTSNRRKPLPYYLTFLFFFISLFAVAQNNAYDKGVKAYDTQDYASALTLMKPFADAGDAKAAFIVAFSYISSEKSRPNDSIFLHYAVSSAEKYYTRAMDLLATYYFMRAKRINEQFLAQAVAWLEIAASYGSAYSATTNRALISTFLNEETLTAAEQVLKEKQPAFNKIDLTAFRALKEPAAFKTNRENISSISEYNLCQSPYTDWVYRWKIKDFEEETVYNTMRYTVDVAPKYIDSVINQLREHQSFPISKGFRDKLSNAFILTNEEQTDLIAQLEKAKSHQWTTDMFPYSKGIKQAEVEKTIDSLKNTLTERQKKRGDVIYTFSKPVFIRNGTIALFLIQARKGSDSISSDFNFFKLENGEWKTLATAYSGYDNLEQP